MSLHLRVYEHLLPRAVAWSLKVTKRLREFFEGLTDLPSDTRDFVDGVYDDIQPQLTRELPTWENQFGLVGQSSLTEQQRRDRLEAEWSALGGQSPRYLQDTVRAAGFDVYFHEWWDLPLTEPPTVRNPLGVLQQGGSAVVFIAECGEAIAECGEASALCGDTTTPKGYALVNKDFGIPYTIPGDSSKWPYFIYFGGETFGDQASVSAARKNEFETLLLKLCPTHLWIGVMADFT